jgi:cytochrome c553
LQAALEAYTRGARKSGFMRTIATELSSAQIAALAHYYAALPVRAAPAPSADPALVQRGETIATQGIPDSAIPPCADCHESSGSRISGAPHIAGQNATYIRRQLEAMRRQDRGWTLAWNPMPAVAHDLADRDIAALAAYYSGVSPAKASGGQAQASPATGPSESGLGDLAAAKTVFAANCAKCHGADGRGDRQGDYPDLTLQSAGYALQTLYEYHAGLRPDVQMRQAVQGLTVDQMKSLAAYVAGMPVQPGLAKPDAAAAARGAALAMHGAPGRGVPACLSCHSAEGAADLPLIPRLQGQNVIYLRAKLSNYAQPYAANLSALNPMPAIASRLTEQERSDLAAYFAAAAPVAKTAARP